MDPKNFESAIFNKTRNIGGKVINSPLEMKACEQSRESIAKFLYGLLFEWIVAKLNQTILPKQIKDIKDKELDLNQFLGIGILGINRETTLFI